MKTMKLGDSFIRIAEKDVKTRINGGWNYCPKSEWKKNVRDFGIKEVSTTAETSEGIVSTKKIKKPRKKRS